MWPHLYSFFCLSLPLSLFAEIESKFEIKPRVSDESCGQCDKDSTIIPTVQPSVLVYLHNVGTF